MHTMRKLGHVQVLPSLGGVAEIRHAFHAIAR
jgi:hypothetical protein